MLHMIQILGEMGSKSLKWAWKENDKKIKSPFLKPMWFKNACVFKKEKFSKYKFKNLNSGDTVKQIETFKVKVFSNREVLICFFPQIDFSIKMVCSINKGIVKKQFPFMTVKNCHDAAGNKFTVSFKGHHDYELEAMSPEDKQKVRQKSFPSKLVLANYVLAPAHLTQLDRYGMWFGKVTHKTVCVRIRNLYGKQDCKHLCYNIFVLFPCTIYLF